MHTSYSSLRVVMNLICLCMFLCMCIEEKVCIVCIFIRQQQQGLAAHANGQQAALRIYLMLGKLDEKYSG